jgi:Flp pilus assembly protein TadB
MIALLAGALVGAGVVCVIAGFTTRNSLPKPAAQRTEISGVDVATGIAGIVGAMVMLIVSRWPVAAIGVGILVAMAVNTLAKPRTTSKIAEARLDALAAWCEQLRDLLKAGELLTPAISTTSTTCPPEIQQSITRLAARMERENATIALRRFADEINDPTGDLVASVLLTATTHSGETAELLSELADLTRERVERRKTIEAERAATKLDMRIIIGVAVFSIVGLLVFSRSSFLDPFRTLVGQTILASIFATFIVAIVWARRLAVYEQPGRFLTVRSTS